MFKKAKEYINSINFRLSDLFFAIGFIAMAVFLIFGQLFMQYSNPNDVAIKAPVFIALFLIMIISWGLYIYLEYKVNNRINRNISLIFVLLFTIGVIGIIVQPHDFVINFHSLSGEELTASTTISIEHRLFFIFELIAILLLIYTGLFIFSKRITSLGFIKFIGYALFALCLSLIIYSYIFEFDKYIPFINYLISAENSGAIKHYAMESYIINPNAYGMVLMMGLMFCCINHSMSHKWWYWLIAFFLFINMVFSFCRACILFSIIFLIIYVYHYLITTRNKNAKIKKITLIALSGVIALAVLIVIISYLSKGAFLKPIYSLISVSFSSAGTLSDREVIWSNTYSLMSQNLGLYFFAGRGFGTLNEMLLQMNNVVGLEGLFPTHNGYLNLFAEGGILYLLLYLLLLFYVLWLFIKCHKKQALFSTALIIGVLVFTFYSLFETIHYLVYPFMFLTCVNYNICYKNSNN